MTKTVALQKCTDYDFDRVYSSIKELFKLVPPPDVKGKKVLLKPNILYPRKPEEAVCTHPVVMGAVVKAFYDEGAAIVYAGESPAIANSTSAAKASGIYDQVVNNGGEWLDFHEKVTIPFPQGKIEKAFTLAKQVQEVDVIVSVAKLKSHQLMSYTGAMKNLFGLMISLDKAQQHYRFPQKSDFSKFLTDLNICANPQYAIIDAILGMDGPGGPGSGDPIKLDFLAASDNILALDWECSSLVGYNPHNIPNLEEALSRKIWLNSEDEITTKGTDPELIRNSKFRIVKEASPTLSKMMPKWLDMLAHSFFVKTPRFDSKKCQKCRRCEQICPAHQIIMEGKNKTAILNDKSKCLHCFCCHEICPHSAIKLKRF